MSVVRKNGLNFPIRWFGEGLYFSAMNAQLSNAVAYGHRKVYIYRKNNPNSGTTVREVEDGIGALDNIRYTKEHLIIKTKKTLRATDWHIWMNNLLIVSYAIGSNAEHKYKKELKSAKRYMKRNLFIVLLHSNVGVSVKIKMIIRGLFPTLATKYTLHKWAQLAKKDFGQNGR